MYGEVLLQSSRKYIGQKVERSFAKNVSIFFLSICIQMQSMQHGGVVEEWSGSNSLLNDPLNLSVLYEDASQQI